MLNEKYRPKTFNEIVGQKITVEILENIVKSKDIRPMLFIGNSGVGKTTLARIFAKELKSELIELDASTNGGVENIRSIIQDAKLKSVTSDLKIFLIDECHCLSSSAWSSFLLELEDNKPHVSYIFLTTEVHKIPETILSRLVTFQLHQLTTVQIENQLKKIVELEQIQISEKGVHYLAYVCKGNIRLAINYLEKVKSLNRFITENDLLELLQIRDSQFILNFLSTTPQDQYTILEQLENDGYDLRFFINQCLSLTIRQSMKQSYNPIIDTLLQIKQAIKEDDFKKETIVGYLWGYYAN